MQSTQTCNAKPYDILKIKNSGKFCVLCRVGTLFVFLSSSLLSSSLLYLLFLFICLISWLRTTHSPQHNSTAARFERLQHCNTHSRHVLCGRVPLHCDSCSVVFRQAFALRLVILHSLPAAGQNKNICYGPLTLLIV
jgi:hypothetical protein